MKKKVILDLETLNPVKEDIKDNFTSDKEFLDGIISDGSSKEKRMARVIKRLLRRVHQLEGSK